MKAQQDDTSDTNSGINYSRMALQVFFSTNPTTQQQILFWIAGRGFIFFSSEYISLKAGFLLKKAAVCACTPQPSGCLLLTETRSNVPGTLNCFIESVVAMFLTGRLKARIASALELPCAIRVPPLATNFLICSTPAGVIPPTYFEGIVPGENPRTISL